MLSSGLDLGLETPQEHYSTVLVSVVLGTGCGACLGLAEMVLHILVVTSCHVIMTSRSSAPPAPPPARVAPSAQNK